MKLWKLMLGTVIVSVFIVWACMAIDGTVKTAKAAGAADYENQVTMNISS